MAAGQTATVTDDGWKTVSGPDVAEDAGWKTISGTADKIALGKGPAKPLSPFQQFKQGVTESLHPKSGPNAGMAERFVNSTVSNFGDAASALAHGHPLDAAGDLLTGYGKAYVPEALAGAGTAGAALLRGSVRPALGLVAGAGTGIAAHKAATALGAPEWLAELASSAAGLAVGGKVGMTPEMQAKFKSTGFRGIIQRWVNGEPKQNEVLEFYKQQHGKLPTTPEEIMTAKAEAADFKKQIATKLKEAGSPEAQKANRLKESADRIRSERGEPKRFDKSVVKAADIPDLTREPTAAPEAKPKTTKEKIEAGRSSKPTVRAKSVVGQPPDPRAEQVPEPSRDEEALGRAHQGFAADVNKRMGGKLLAKGLTPDQVMQMDEDEFYQAVGPDRKFRGKLDPATGKPTSTHRTFEQGRNDVAAWMKLHR